MKKFLMIVLFFPLISYANNIKKSYSYSVLDPETKYPIRVIEWTPDRNSNMRCVHVIGGAGVECYKVSGEMLYKQRQEEQKTK